MILIKNKNVLLAFFFIVLTLTTLFTLTTFTSNKADAAILPLTGTIGGSVFRDYDANGTRNSVTEPGQPGIEVIANCVSDDGATSNPDDDIYSNYGPVISAADGSFSLTNIPAAMCRIEAKADSSQTWLTQAVLGSQTSSVQFVDASTSPSVSFAFMNPHEYVGDQDPQVVMPLQLPLDPLAAGSIVANSRALMEFPYSLNDTSTGGPYSSSNLGKITDNVNIGSTWGVAYKRSSNEIFVSAQVKRHSGMGPSGPDAIYRVNRATGTTTDFTTAVDADGGVIPSNALRLFPNAMFTPYVDGAVFSEIGKTGWGDIDISEDESTLYGVNLRDKSLYSFDTSTGATLDSTLIPDPGCSGGSWRPWGLGIKDNKVYAGGVCDAQTSGAASDITIAIFAYDIDSSTWSSNLLDGDGLTAGIQLFSADYSTRVGQPWQSWSDNMSDPGWASFGTIFFRPQPIFSDIQFDNDGSIIMSLKDRTGDQLSAGNYSPTGISSLQSAQVQGDVLRATPTIDTYGNPTSFFIEDNGIAPSGPTLPIARTGGPSNNNGPGGGEFYVGDSHPTFPNHNETSQGAALIIPGKTTALITTMDPTHFNSGGIKTVSNNDGSASNLWSAYENIAPYTMMGKSNGLGDLEALAEPAPVEIGNRVWFDANRNGIQDPSEAAIAGVLVELRDSSGTVIASATTDSNGNYLFSGQSSADRTGTLPGASTSHVFDIPELVPGAGDFSIAIPNAIGTSQQSVLSGYVITADNTSSDTVDSDGINVGSESIVEFTIDSAGDVERSGDNNHSFDFGFNLPAPIVTTTTSTSPTTTSVIAPPGVKGASGVLPVTGVTITFILGTAMISIFVGLVTSRKRRISIRSSN